MIKKNKKIEVEDLQGEGVIQLGEVLALHLVQGEPDLARAVFFFKQKTAYEVSVSDWSSDVCSSDLAGRGTSCSRRHRWPSRGSVPSSRPLAPSFSRSSASRPPPCALSSSWSQACIFLRTPDGSKRATSRWPTPPRMRRPAGRSMSRTSRNSPSPARLRRESCGLRFERAISAAASTI